MILGASSARQSCGNYRSIARGNNVRTLPRQSQSLDLGDGDTLKGINLEPAELRRRIWRAFRKPDDMLIEFKRTDYNGRHFGRTINLLIPLASPSDASPSLPSVFPLLLSRLEVACILIGDSFSDQRRFHLPSLQRFSGESVFRAN